MHYYSWLEYQQSAWHWCYASSTAVMWRYVGSPVCCMLFWYDIEVKCRGIFHQFDHIVFHYRIYTHTNPHTHTHTHPFNGPFSGTTRVGRYQKGKTNLNFTEARDSEWQWHQLGHMQVCTLLQTDNHASTSPLSFLQARCPSCCPTNSLKALKA